MELSKMCKECRKCSFKDLCKNKRMVAYMQCSTPNSRSSVAQVSQPMAVKHTPIMINLGENTKMQTSIEEIKKQMEKEFYENAGLGISSKLKRR